MRAGSSGEARRYELSPRLPSTRSGRPSPSRSAAVTLFHHPSLPARPDSAVRSTKRPPSWRKTRTAIHSPATTRSSAPSPLVSSHAPRRDHPRQPQALRLFVRHVTKAPTPIVLQQHASRDLAIPARHHSASHEQVDIAVAVPVGRKDARAVLAKDRERLAGARERATPVVQVEPVRPAPPCRPRTRSRHSRRRGPGRRRRRRRRRPRRRPRRGSRRQATVAHCGERCRRAPAAAAYPPATWRRRRTCRPGRRRSRRPPRAPAPRWRGDAASTARDCSRGSRSPGGARSPPCAPSRQPIAACRRATAASSAAAPRAGAA